MNNKCNETLNIRIDKITLDNIKQIATEKGIPYSQLIRDMIKKYIEENM